MYASVRSLHIVVVEATGIDLEQCAAVRGDAHLNVTYINHRGLKFDPSITPIASKLKAHNVIT